MRAWWKIIERIISGSNSASVRTQDGFPTIRSRSFSALPLSAQEEINTIIEAQQLVETTRVYGGQPRRLADAVRYAETMVPRVLNTITSTQPIHARTLDNFGYRDMLMGGGQGGIANNAWMSGMNGADPALNNLVRPNLYISPGEVAAVYSNGGLPAKIIQKKSKTMLRAGVVVRNPRLSREQLERVNDGVRRCGLDVAVSDSLRDSLVYGGGVLYPMFKGDSPLSMAMPVEVLVKHGVVRKNCIDYFVSLDRWNTTHYPQWKPTAPDFLKPRYFYIPFLGCDVHSSRICRIVPNPQSGYWGVMMTMGWGVSDMISWIESVLNYVSVMSAIPTMIQQMSIIARTFQVDGPLATEGAMILDEVTANETIRVREASPLNPVNLDVVGKLEAIQRDFSQVPELTKLIRQDVAAKCGLKEQSLFTVEKKGMGGSTGEAEDVIEAESAALELMYGDLKNQYKPAAMIQVINELGIDRDVLKALPYTELDFSAATPMTVAQRIEMVKAITKGAFDTTASGYRLQDAAEVMEQLSGGMFEVSNDLYKALEERQTRNDEMEDETHDAEIDQAQAQVDSAYIVDNGTTKTSKKTTKSTNGAGHSYEDKLEQRKHEVIRSGGRKREGLSKARGKAKSIREGGKE